MKALPLIGLGLAIIAFATHSCRAQPPEAQVRQENGEQDADWTVLPTRQCGDYFIVDAVIDGKGPFPMLLDTGAGTTIISKQVAKAIESSKRIGKIAIGGFEASGKIPCRAKKIDHLSRALGQKIDGILSYQVFFGVLLTYDFPRREIRVKKGCFDENELKQDGIVPTSKGTRPFVHTSVGEKEFSVLIDTGSGRGLTLKKLERFTLAEAPQPTGARMRINGMFIVNSARLAGDMKLGPLTLKQPIVNNSVSVNLVGQAVLRDYVLTFDQKNYRVLFSKPKGDLKTPILCPPLYGTGMATAPRDDRLIIRKVFAGSSAEDAGLQVNDEIVELNGTPIAERGCAHLEFKPNKGPRSIAMSIRRKDKPMKVEFTTAVLVK